LYITIYRFYHDGYYIIIDFTEFNVNYNE